MLSHPGMEVGGSRFTGSPSEAKGIAAILLAVLAFGVIAFFYGVFQVVTGRRNLAVVYVLVGIAGALYFTGLLL
jgi:hypothetical protein